MPTKYRPSTGQEWQAFDAEWCAECAKVGTCTILAEAAERSLAAADYPRELIVRNGTPVCTAFSSARAVAS